MSADFVPFLQSLNARLNSSTPAAEFSALPHNAGSHASPSHSAVSAAEVKVELKRDGDRVTQIRIQCCCGELIELNCDYGG
jgi:hypothetical protein